MVPNLGRLHVDDNIFVSGYILSHRGASVAQQAGDFKHYTLAKSQKIC